MKTTKVMESKQNDSAERMAGSTAQIREAIKKAEPDLTCVAPDKRLQKILEVLNENDKKELIQAVLDKFYNSDELKPYQAELIKIAAPSEKKKGVKGERSKVKG